MTGGAFRWWLSLQQGGVPAGEIIIPSCPSASTTDQNGDVSRFHVTVCLCNYPPIRGLIGETPSNDDVTLTVNGSSVGWTLSNGTAHDLCMTWDVNQPLSYGDTISITFDVGWTNPADGPTYNVTNTIPAPVQLRTIPSFDAITGRLIQGSWYNIRTDDNSTFINSDGYVEGVSNSKLIYTGARVVQNLAALTATPSTQNITVVSGRKYLVSIGAGSAVGATAVCSNAFIGTITGDANGVDRVTFADDVPRTATSATLTITITGDVVDLQVQDVTNKAINNALEEYESAGVGYGDEVVVNGSFDSATNWILGAGYTITGGQLIGVNTGAWAEVVSQTFVNSNGWTANVKHVIEVDVDSFVGAPDIYVKFGGGSFGAAQTPTAQGILRFYGTPVNITNDIEIQSNIGASESITINSVSIRRASVGYGIYDTERRVFRVGDPYAKDVAANSDFSSTDYWTLGPGWSISGGQLTGANTGAWISQSTQTIGDSNGWLVGTQFEITVAIASVVGSPYLYCKLGGGDFGSAKAPVAGQALVFVGTATTTDDIQIQGDIAAGESVVIDSIIIRSITTSTSETGRRFSDDIVARVYGDSQTYDSTDISHRVGNYLNVGWTLANTGYPGYRLEALQDIFAADSPLGCDVVVLQGGINNLATALVTPLPVMKAAMREMVASAAEQGIQIIIINVTPWGNNSYWTAQRQAWTEEYNSWLQAVYGALVVDAYNLLLDAPNALLAIYDQGDGLHLNAAGCALVDSRIAGLIKDVRPVMRHAPAATNQISESSPSTTYWTKRGAITIATVSEGHALGKTTQVRSLGAAGVNDFYLSMGGGTFSNSIRIEPSCLIKAVSTSGSVRIQNVQGPTYGQWTIDLSLLSTSAFGYLTRNHAAVTVNTEFTSTATGAAGLQYYAVSGSLNFDLLGVQLETGSVSTPSIKTTTAPASRTIDQILHPNVLDQAQGSIVLRVKLKPGTYTPTADRGLVTIDTAVNNMLYLNSGDSISVESFDSTNTVNSGVVVQSADDELGIYLSWANSTIYPAAGNISVGLKNLDDAGAWSEATGVYDGGYPETASIMRLLSGLTSEATVTMFKIYDNHQTPTVLKGIIDA